MHRNSLVRIGNRCEIIFFNPFQNDNFETIKVKDFADDNFKFDESDRKFSKKR